MTCVGAVAHDEPQRGVGMLRPLACGLDVSAQDDGGSVDQWWAGSTWWSWVATTCA